MMNEKTYKWIEFGDYDLIVVENELAVTEERQIAQIIAFHCQQAAEKYLKAFLIYKTHNLEYLIQLCSKYNVDFSKLDVGELSNFAVDIRYPEIDFIPSAPEIQYYYEKIKEIREFVLKRIK